MQRIGAALMFGIWVGMACGAQAQTPYVRNAKQTTRSAASGLSAIVDEIARVFDTVAWIGYAVPAIPDRGSNCCGSGGSNDGGDCCGCTLEDGARRVETRPPPAVPLAASDQALVFLRIERHAIGKVRVFADDCPIDGNGLSIVWLTDVPPEGSLRFLETLVLARFTPQSGDDGEGASRGVSNGALAAIAVHRADEADAVLGDLALPSRPDGLRKQVTFWMGAARGHRGYQALVHIVRDDPSERMRDSAVFGLSVSHDPEAVPAMIVVAKNDRSAQVRSQALFWLSQKASKTAADAISEAIAQDPETDVKKKAVFALSQLPPDDGLPLLIRVARENTNPAVRKEAMFWLGQSNDPRALRFFEEILR